MSTDTAAGNEIGGSKGAIGAASLDAALGERGRLGGEMRAGIGPDGRARRNEPNRVTTPDRLRQGRVRAALSRARAASLTERRGIERASALLLINRQGHEPSGSSLFVNVLHDDEVGTGQRSRLIAVLVLGMHRSGTSSVAGALVHLGGHAPLHMMPPQPDNERGFWESPVIMALNDDVLAAGDSGWTDL